MEAIMAPGKMTYLASNAIFDTNGSPLNIFVRINEGLQLQRFNIERTSQSLSYRIMRPKIYLFGDSITEESFSDGGWGASLSHHFSRSADIVLRGYSGYNTRWALKVFDRVFPAGGVDGSEAPLAVVVFFGANDACLPDRCSAFQHVPLEEYKQNLCSIVSSLKKRWHKTVIFLITPPPIDEAARLRDTYLENKTGKSERTNEAAGEYAKACTIIAKECEILVADIWTKMQESPNWGETYLRYSFSRAMTYSLSILLCF
ncbi:hypothetical protein V2J09_019504 [Rumex salicifolius]